MYVLKVIKGVDRIMLYKILQPVKLNSLKLTLHEALSEVCTLHQVKFAPYTKLYVNLVPTKGEQNTRYIFYIVTRNVILSSDDDAIGELGFRDVTLAYDDDAIGELGFRDVTLAYDDDAKGM